MSIACNSTTIFQAITNVYGGNVTVQDSFVTAYNSTNIFEGDEITLQGNNDITIQQSNTMNETTVWDIDPGIYITGWDCNDTHCVVL